MCLFLSLFFFSFFLFFGKKYSKLNLLIPIETHERLNLFFSG